MIFWPTVMRLRRYQIEPGINERRGKSSGLVVRVTVTVVNLNNFSWELPA